MSRSFRSRLFGLPLRPIGWLALAIYLAASAGVPLPTGTMVASTERFPCESHGCGCVDSEHCWRQCCCFTPEDKLAWAARHGVTPPAYAAKQSTRKSCCSAASEGGAQACTSSPASSQAESQEQDWTFGFRMLRCRGQSGVWLLAEPAVPPRPIEFSAELSPGCDLAPVWIDARSELALAPPVPPPRRAALSA